jgi:nicotinamidase-related amidase
MPGLHGSKPRRSRVALLLVDVINAMDFPEGKALARLAAPAAKRIAALKERAKAAGVPVIYANDNYGQWHSDFRATLESAIAPDMPGREISLMLAPEADDYFVLKPKHSAFYGSPLEILLSELGSERVVLAGFAGDICVQFTAQDAFLRDIEIVVPSDCTASETVAANREALAYMREALRVTVVPSAKIDFRAWKRAR